MAESEKEVIRGTVEKIHFTRDGWSAGRLRVVNDGGEVACWPPICTVSFAGRINVRVGEAVGLRGHWTHHEKWGDQFEADDVVFEERLDKDGLVAWLSTHEDAVGIGEVRARRVADQFGDAFTLALKFRPLDVAKVAGVSAERIEKLAASWFRMEEFNAVGAKLSAWGLTRRQIETLYAAYGNGIIRVLEEDPYVICREVEGYGFRRADDIAQKLGTPKTHPGRIRAGILYEVSEALGEGSTCLKKLDLLTKAEKLLALDQLEAPDIVMSGIEELVQAEALVSFGDGEYYAGEGIHSFERFLADWLRDGDRINPHFHPEMLSPTIDAYCGALDGSQLEAAYNALGHRFALISGGAGSGKTFSVNALRNAYEAAGKTVALCAPTGKAARRLEQVTGQPAQTIHRLLEYGRKRSDDPDDPAYYRNQYGFARNEKRPICASVVILDESSMLDVALGRHLACAIGPQTAVVFVGDHNQLPAVGPGAVLRDCLRHDLMPATILQHCHRQAGPLKRNCAAILEGIVAPSEPEPESGPAPWYVHRKLKEPRDVLACLERLYADVIPNRWGLDPFWETQFLTPMHKGELGTRSINVLLQRVHQKRLGVEVQPVPEKGRVRLYAGDKVINTRNNYKIDVMNGHQGVVVQPAPLIVKFQDGATHAIPDEDRGDIELAYCISAHKSQGSEWPCVVIVCHRLHQFMLHRGWLYTSCTRAQKVSILLGDEYGITKAAREVKENERQTYLDWAGGNLTPEGVG